MKKKPVLILIWVLLLVLPATVHAKRPDTITFGIDALQYNDLAAAATSIKRIEKGLKLQTTGLRGTGTLNCNGDTVCEKAGLDGAELRVGQDMQILIDVIGAGVKGRARGILGRGEAKDILRWQGRVRGTAECLDSPCRTLDVKMTISGKIFDKNSKGVKGRLVLSLAGQLTLDPDQGTANWQALEGTGAAVVDGTVYWG